MNDKYRMRCLGKFRWVGGPDYPRMTTEYEIEPCGWRGIRTDHIECECYDINTLYCRALTPGPGCPRGIDYPCPRCKGEVTGRLIER